MILSTDSTANLPKEYYEKLNIKMIPMQIILNDSTYNDLSPELPIQDYYQKMKGATGLEYKRYGTQNILVLRYSLSRKGQHNSDHYFSCRSHSYTYRHCPYLLKKS